MLGVEYGMKMYRRSTSIEPSPTRTRVTAAALVERKERRWRIILRAGLPYEERNSKFRRHVGRFIAFSSPRYLIVVLSACYHTELSRQSSRNTINDLFRKIEDQLGERKTIRG